MLKLYLLFNKRKELKADLYGKTNWAHGPRGVIQLCANSSVLNVLKLNNVVSMNKSAYPRTIVDLLKFQIIANFKCCFTYGACHLLCINPFGH
jgi:hypothetical protein